MQANLSKTCRTMEKQDSPCSLLKGIMIILVYYNSGIKSGNFFLVLSSSKFLNPESYVKNKGSSSFLNQYVSAAQRSSWNE